MSSLYQWHTSDGCSTDALAKLRCHSTPRKQNFWRGQGLPTRAQRMQSGSPWVPGYPQCGRMMTQSNPWPKKGF